LLPEQPWQESSADGLAAIVGHAGDNPLTLRLSDLTPHWLIGGVAPVPARPPSLSTSSMDCPTRYGPDQLSLYLLDFKEGVSFTEFTPTRRDPTWIPHARAVGIESDREYGLAVLRELEAEMAARAERYKDAGVTRFRRPPRRRPAHRRPRRHRPTPRHRHRRHRHHGHRPHRRRRRPSRPRRPPPPTQTTLDLRHAAPAVDPQPPAQRDPLARRPETLPRIVCVIDEFQVLVQGSDRLAREAVAALESLARKGRSYGIQLILASQTVRGVESLYTKRDSIFGQFPVRVALPGGGDVLDPLNQAANPPRPR